MKLDEIVAWYQKKIGTYDKQQWEKTVEQKILDGFSSVTLKTAKLKTELIDVDLVRGSTFPKAKPKQSLLTVVRLAIQRFFLLPCYAQWWVKQTSYNAFALLFTLYMLQMLSWAIYTYNTNQENAQNSLNLASQINGTSSASSQSNNEEEHIVFLSDLLIPMALSLLLSLIHSQIVATNIATGVKAKRRRFSNATATSSGGLIGSGSNNKLGREPRPRRRKKLVKVRSQDNSDSNCNAQSPQQQQQRKTLAAQNTLKIEQQQTTQQPPPTTNQQQYTSLLLNKNKIGCTQNQSASNLPPSNRLMTLDLNNTLMSSSANCEALSQSKTDDCLANNYNNASNKKRNVNWHSPIHNFAVETQEKQQQTSPQTNSTTTTSTSSSETNTPNANKTAQNSSSSASNSQLATPVKTVRIDECVQEFYDELVTRAEEILLPPAPVNPTEAAESAAESNEPHPRRPIGEDDGFESLNGKSSSGEETNASLLPTTSSTLRLRLNATAARADEFPVGTSTVYRRKLPLSSESDADKNAKQSQTKNLRAIENDTTDHTDEDGDDIENVSSPASAGGTNSNYTECTTSATEWLGVTTNSEECSYSSELENSDDYSKNQQYSDEDGLEMDFVPATILNPHNSSDRISCTIWEQRDIKKAQMSVLEISSCIIERVESMPETNDYILLGIVFSLILSFVPTFCRLCEVTIDTDKTELSYWDLPMLLWEKSSFSFFTLFHFAFGQTQWERAILVMSLIQRFCLTMMLFMIFGVAERTFKQRFLYAKLFSHLTSSRRARKSNLPHFRLNKVRNIKTWLSVRSYLKKRGPQRSVDVIVSAAFIITHLLLAFLSVEWLKDSTHLHSHLNLEALMWSSTVGIFLLRFMTLGNKIHQKYRSISVLITEQINLYLQIEQKPKKKDELMVSNSVLKLAADLLKELESPFKVSGLRANPYLFTTLKVVILSALSGVLSEMLGFKLKLLKIKIK